MIKINKKYYILIIIFGILIIIIFLFVNKKEDYEYIDMNDVLLETTSAEKLEQNNVEEKIKIHILGEVNYNVILD